MTDSSYYRLRIHRAKCPICMFTEKIRDFTNKKILRGDSIESITDYIINKHPIYSKDDSESFNFIIRSHAEYLDTMLSDIKVKTMFKSIRSQLDDVDIDDMKLNDKLKLIQKLEDELNIERDNMNDEQTSILKALTNETLPLLIGRFNKEIIRGNAQAIRLLSNSVSMTLDSLTDLNKKIKHVSEEIKDIDEMELLEIDSSRKEKVVSLSDRIQQAVGNSD